MQVFSTLVSHRKHVLWLVTEQGQALSAQLDSESKVTSLLGMRVSYSFLSSSLPSLPLPLELNSEEE